MKSLEIRLKEFNATRQQLTCKLKCKLMAGDEFSFFRATCHLFYEDLALRAELNQGPLTWVCGDLHLENFGSYRAANGLTYFDINDFDEAALTYASWDLVRFLCSIGMAANLWKYSMEEAKNLMILTLQVYAHLLAGSKPYAIQEETSPPLIVKFFEMADREKEKKMVKQRIDPIQEKLRIIPGKTFPIDDQQRETILKTVNEFLTKDFAHLEVRDVAFRVAGTGSLGVRRYVLLTYDSQKDKFRLLDIKESLPSSLSAYLSTAQPPWLTEADRIVAVQSMMQYALPRFMGKLAIEGRHYVLKQLQPSNQKIDHRLCHKKMRNVETVMTVMAEALASAQLRSASRKHSASVEELVAFAQEPSWRETIVQTALGYTAVMKNYYLEYTRLYQTGKMEVV